MGEFTSAQKSRLVETSGAHDCSPGNEIRVALSQSDEGRHIDLADRVHCLGRETMADMLTGLASRPVQRHRRELHEIEAARSRLAEGSVNRCVECGQEIDFGELLSNSVVVHCLA